jgi:hypothetical protein
MNRSKGPFKTKVVNKLFKAWDHNHAPLEFAEKSFNPMWKERTKQAIDK